MCLNGKRSRVWFHYSILNSNDSKSRCNYCWKSFSFKSGNINNLRRHLKSAHPTVNIDEDVTDRGNEQVDDPAPLNSNSNNDSEPSTSQVTSQTEPQVTSQNRNVHSPSRFRPNIRIFAENGKN